MDLVKMKVDPLSLVTAKFVVVCSQFDPKVRLSGIDDYTKEQKKGLAHQCLICSIGFLINWFKYGHDFYSTAIHICNYALCLVQC